MYEITNQRKQTILWTSVGIAILVLIYFLSPVLSPFLLALGIAYVLAPGVKSLKKLRFPQWLAVSIMISLLFLVIVSLLIIIIPLIRREVSLVIQQLPEWIVQYNQNIAPKLNQWFSTNSTIEIGNIRNLLQEAVSSTDNIFISVLNYIKTGGGAVALFIANMLLTPVVLIYLLFDWVALKKQVKDLIPRHYLQTSTEIIIEIDKLLSSFLRGQLLVMLILATFYSIGLMIAGFDNAIPIGVLTGLLVFIPYLGFGLGLLLAILSALLQFDSYYGLIAVAIVFGLGQLLESLYLTPRVVGDRIGLHPLVVILALFIFGDIFGFFGVLMALPMSAALSVLIRRAYAKYRSSSFYTHE